MSKTLKAQKPLDQVVFNIVRDHVQAILSQNVPLYDSDEHPVGKGVCACCVSTLRQDVINAVLAGFHAAEFGDEMVPGAAEA